MANPPSTFALRHYEHLAACPHRSIGAVTWRAEAELLRDEALSYTGDQAKKRLDRAEQCDANATRAAHRAARELQMIAVVRGVA